MSKYCFNYESGEFEFIDRNGFSVDRGEFTYNWDDSQYKREEEEERFQQFRNSNDDDRW